MFLFQPTPQKSQLNNQPRSRFKDIPVGAGYLARFEGDVDKAVVKLLWRIDYLKI
jgi:hypothetical protein